MQLKKLILPVLLVCTSHFSFANHNKIEDPKVEETDKKKKKSKLLYLTDSEYKSDGLIKYNAFIDSRVINGHSTSTLHKKWFDFRILHRFGDIAGAAGGGRTLYGLDQVTDVRIAFEYGISSKLNIGLGRSKGAGPLRELFDGYAKYQFVKQDNKSNPVTITGVLGASIATQEKSLDSTSVTSFEEFAHRMNYFSQILISRRFSDRLSLQLSPTYSHRNYVNAEDDNVLFSIGFAGRYRISKLLAISGEYYLSPKDRLINGVQYRNSAAIGLELNTGGHVFYLNFTNSRGIGETQTIPYTSANIADGQFRFGFTISRIFKL